MVYQLSCCMLIRFGNDAFTVLADYVGQVSIEKFVDSSRNKIHAFPLTLKSVSKKPFR